MNKLLISLLLALSVNVAMAQGASSCSVINNDDARNYCQAKATRNVGYCSSINSDDKRHYCEAVAGNNPSRCDTINDSDKRAMCRADSKPF